MLKKLCLLAAMLGPSHLHAAVLGLFGSDCLELEGGLSTTKDVFFAADSYELVQTVYVDAMCENPAYDFSFSGSYTLDSAQGTIDFHFDNIRLTALDERIARAFGEERLCGWAEWQQNSSTNIAGRNCGGQQVPTQDAVAYDMFQEVEGLIQFGKADQERDGSTPQKRPLVLDETVYRAK